VIAYLADRIFLDGAARQYRATEEVFGDSLKSVLVDSRYAREALAAIHPADAGMRSERPEARGSSRL
jgi:hypothetical protein